MKHQVKTGFGLLFFGALLTTQYLYGWFPGGGGKGIIAVGLVGAVFVLISIYLIIFGIDEG